MKDEKVRRGQVKVRLGPSMRIPRGDLENELRLCRESGSVNLIRRRIERNEEFEEFSCFVQMIRCKEIVDHGMCISL